MPSVYEIITEKIIKQLESGVAPWRKPWTCQTPANLITQKEYRGLNVFTLASQGFPSRFWLTFNQATKLGGRIRKGEKSSPVIFWNVGEERETTTQDGTKRPRGLFCSATTVCSICRRRRESTSPHPFCRRPAPTILSKRANKLWRTCRTRQRSSNPIKRGTRRVATWSVCQHAASFTPRKNITPLEFHELAHSTGHAKRLHRENFDNPVSFGSESYSKEELIAEMTAAMLCGIAGIEQKTLENSAAYLKTWIARLKSDSRLLVSAASQAQKAADFIQGKAVHVGLRFSGEIRTC